MCECLVLFGIDDNIKTDSVFDFILLLAKQYLYKCKRQTISQTLMFLEGNYYPVYKKEYNAVINCSCPIIFCQVATLQTDFRGFMF